MDGDVRVRYGHRGSRPRPWLFVAILLVAGAVAGVTVWSMSGNTPGSTARSVVVLVLAVGLPATVVTVLIMLWRRALFVEITGSALRWSGLLRRGEISLAALRRVRIGWTARDKAGQRTRFVAFHADGGTVVVHEAPVGAEGSLGAVVDAVLAGAPHVRVSDETRH